MKKSRGFTLIELLIVTVVIAILMAIVFRLAGTGSDSTKRATTISRLQKLANAVSGYYAAFGSYPPVPLQGRSRDIYTKVSGGSMGYGIQGPSSERDSGSWDKHQIEAACRAQPVGAGYPLDPKTDEEETLATLHEALGTPLYHVVNSKVGALMDGSADWSDSNVFMFGLLSFLLPRYQFMMDGHKELYTIPSWVKNNRAPYLIDGERKEWTEIHDKLGDPEMRAKIKQMPSQAVCARWMPNFEGIVDTYPFRTRTVFYGVDTQVPGRTGFESSGSWLVFGDEGYSSSQEIYANNLKTVLDGWDNQLYYYSLPPYQSYQLWSAGPNGCTFPPWIDKSTLKGSRLDDVNKWIADDIKVGDK